MQNTQKTQNIQRELLIHCHPPLKKESESETSSTDTTEGSNEDTGVSVSNYSALEKEQKKGKPNPLVINKYLNLEFASRRQLIQETAKDEKPRIILELYPRFKHPHEMMALDCQPFSIVTDEGFTTLMKVPKPRYRMPTLRKVTETIVEAYKLQVLQIKKELDENADYVNVTMVIWSSRNLGSYISVTGQWASKANGKLKIRCLAVWSMTGSHTGENIDTHLKTVFTEYGISTKVFVILRDNASNMARAMFIGEYTA
ncbi:zinc finger BED domain-containing 4-like [Paramuricea clavata]|uniref:Zinc finger BED domain-containing 4-like n=1 Tax=Paramuricea clavata TaxID=317549 RepID=A0A6S7HLQ8_PARCT|nr:zinc finger BED domain-containing 4-like [Paramuricea clavata]